jgi:quinol monooxygenase YgiN
MPYVRLSIATPSRGQADRANELMRKLADAARETKGCIASYLLKPTDGSSEVGRITIYEDEASADAMANTQTMLSLRSELHLVIEAGHIERAFTTV